MDLKEREIRDMGSPPEVKCVIQPPILQIPTVPTLLFREKPLPPSLPPSPPSSCEGQSPPSTPKSPQILPVLPPSPPLPPSPLIAPKSLSFSIANILRPDFGTHSKNTSETLIRTPPKTPELRPVDLSHKSSETVQSKVVHIEQKEGCQSIFKSSTNSSTNPRVRYPDNPEQLANPKVPDEDMVWPAWVYCTRYSDRPSSGPRSRRMKKREKGAPSDEKRPRTAFTSEQQSRLVKEFNDSKYLTEKRRQELARDLGLRESQIKIWFQNRRAKVKKTTVGKTSLAQHLIAQGLYNHSTVAMDEDDPFII